MMLAPSWKGLFEEAADMTAQVSTVWWRSTGVRLAPHRGDAHRFTGADSSGPAVPITAVDLHYTVTMDAG